MPTVKFNLRDEVMKEALNIKEQLGITWREATLQGLGFSAVRPRVGRPKKTKYEKSGELLNVRIQAIAIEEFYKSVVARDIFPVKKWDDIECHVDDVITPVLDKTFSIYKNGKLDVTGIKRNARVLAEEEDRLMLSGEHDGWPAMGIQGLSTVDNRNVMASSGRWPEHAINDLIAVKNDGSSNVLLAPSKIINCLNNVFWQDPDHIKPPITHANFLLDSKMLRGIYASDNIYAEDGGQDSAIVFSPSIDNAYILELMEPTSQIWTTRKTGWMCTFRESVTPIILNPQAITEIHGIVRAS